MNTLHDDETLRAAFAPARELEPTDAEVATIVSRTTVDQRASGRTRGRSRTRDRHLRRLALTGLVAAVVLAGGYAAAAPVRAAIDDLTGTFSGWLGGASAQAPGRALAKGDAAPDFMRDPRYARDPRVIAEAGGYKLFVSQAPGGGLDFDLGNTGVGLGGGFGEDFREHAISVLGPGAMQTADKHGHVPLFGVVAREVASVELTYDSGPPLRVDGVSGGFVLLAEPDRSPREVVALDASGHELERRLVDDSKHDCPCIDWSHYGPYHPPPG